MKQYNYSHRLLTSNDKCSLVNTSPCNILVQILNGHRQLKPELMQKLVWWLSCGIQ